MLHTSQSLRLNFWRSGVLTVPLNECWRQHIPTVTARVYDYHENDKIQS